MPCGAFGISMRASTGPSREGRNGPLLPTVAVCASSSGVPRASLVLAPEELGALRRREGLHDPLFRGPYMQHRISWADEPQELHSPGQEDLVQRSREHGAAARHRGHELSAATCIKVDLIREISTHLRADPYQLGSVLVRCGS